MNVNLKGKKEHHQSSQNGFVLMRRRIKVYHRGRFLNGWRNGAGVNFMFQISG
jgi:hypothetical protein